MTLLLSSYTWLLLYILYSQIIFFLVPPFSAVCLSTAIFIILFLDLCVLYKKTNYLNSRWFVSWSSRESNPGPNMEPICFLHAQSLIDFRQRSGKRHPSRSLASLIFAFCPKQTQTNLTLTAPRLSVGVRCNLRRDVSSPLLERRLSLESSKDQAARAQLFSPIKILCPGFTGRFTAPDMLTYQFIMLSNPGLPQ